MDENKRGFHTCCEKLEMNSTVWKCMVRKKPPEIILVVENFADIKHYKFLRLSSGHVNY